MDSSNQQPEPAPSDSTEVLTARARQGGRAEIEQLYVRTLPALVSWIELRRRSSPGMKIEPADLAQEVWLRALQNFARFDPALGCFRAWILGIAKTVWLEHSNPRRRGTTPLLQAPEARLAAEADSITSVTRALARDECVGRFLEAVQALEPLDRMIVIHHGLEGLSCAATGERLELSAEAVSKRWQRVQARLRDLPVGRDLIAER